MKKKLNRYRLVLGWLMPVVLAMILMGWGYVGHQKISGGIVVILPESMQAWIPGWTDLVRLHASDADYRKDTDPNEAPRHYIDIDNYTEFLQTGKINHNLDSMIVCYGYSFVYDQGILPWATLTAYDSMVTCMARRDWGRAGLFAADLGHYVGDGHMPLHLTRNYNGQYTGQTGIHSRYESKLIGRYGYLLTIEPDSCLLIGDVPAFIFAYIYVNYGYKDSILLADAYATSMAGNTYSDLYYQAMWDCSAGFTHDLFQHGSRALASLIYTGWVEAGRPPIQPDAIPEEMASATVELLPVFPNPAGEIVNIPLIIRVPGTPVKVTLWNLKGVLIEAIADTVLPEGTHLLQWHAASIPAGVYLFVLRSGSLVRITRVVATG